MESIATHLEKIKNLLDTRTDFIDEVREIIFRISGVELKANELVWQAPTLMVKTSSLARNLVLRHREKILVAFADHFIRAAPKFIR